MLARKEVVGVGADVDAVRVGVEEGESIEVEEVGENIEEEEENSGEEEVNSEREEVNSGEGANIEGGEVITEGEVNTEGEGEGEKVGEKAEVEAGVEEKVEVVEEVIVVEAIVVEAAGVELNKLIVAGVLGAVMLGLRSLPQTQVIIMETEVGHRMAGGREQSPKQETPVITTGGRQKKGLASRLLQMKVTTTMPGHH